jgi:two-component system, NtrC family, sensor histidine kinase KinB
VKIKAKLRLGIGLLFLLIVLLTLLSSLFIKQLKNDTQNILVANYNTLDYSRQMMIALNEGIGQKASAQLFADNLHKQQRNITELGEQELTDKLAQDFGKMQQGLGDSGLVKQIRTDITDIMLLNMQAIQRKSTLAENTAGTATFWITLVGTICFLIAFTLLVNLPGNIANPLKELTNSIKQIAAENYTERVHFEKHNEFGELAASFNTMAEKLEEYKAGNMEKLMMEKKRIETLINNMHDPVIGLDANNGILFMNDTALKVAGLQNETIIGRPVTEIAAKNDLMRKLIEGLLDNPLPSDDTKNAPVKIYADNKESYFEKQLIPIKIVPTGEKAEKLIGNVILLQNITPYKELDFAKTNFIATVSHELKTPISAIKMSVQLLNNKQIGPLNEEQADLLNSIQGDADRLLKITGELLNMAQVESGTIQMAVMPVMPQEITEYAIGSNKAAADNKQIKLELTLQENMAPVLADKEKTAWVLTNLLSNAIRYSYDNATVFVNVAQVGNQIQFSVTDGGQGIPPQYIDKIFDRYFRIPGTRKEGTGLGLSISKEFIEAQGGSISVKSDLGAGSVFSFTLSAATA